MNDLSRFEKEFSFFASHVKFWDKEGKVSANDFAVKRVDGDILNHTVGNGDIVLAYSDSCGKSYGQKQLEVGKKVIEQLKEKFGCIPDDLYLAANLKPHIEIPELSRKFGLERADFWTVWKPQPPFNVFYKKVEYDDVKESNIIVEARIEKGYMVSYPWALYPTYISVSKETFGVLRTTRTPYETWEEVGDDFKVPPKEILSAREVTKRLLAGEPLKDFEDVGVNITKPRGLHQYGYHHHASGISVPWEQLKWEADAGIPENCKNLGYSQGYFLISDKEEAFIIKTLAGERFLEMPDSAYGALVIGSSEQAKRLRDEIRKAENEMMEDDYFGYMVDKVVGGDVWAAIRVLPDGKYRVEEWSDSSNESDYSDHETLDAAILAAEEFVRSNK